MSLVTAARALGAALVLATAIGARADEATPEIAGAPDSGVVAARVEGGVRPQTSAPLDPDRGRFALGLRDGTAVGAPAEPPQSALGTTAASPQAQADAARGPVGRRESKLRFPLSHRLGLEAGLVDRYDGAAPAETPSQISRHLLGLNLRF